MKYILNIFKIVFISVVLFAILAMLFPPQYHGYMFVIANLLLLIYCGRQVILLVKEIRGK